MAYFYIQSRKVDQTKLDNLKTVVSEFEKTLFRIRNNLGDYRKLEYLSDDLYAKLKLLKKNIPKMKTYSQIGKIEAILEDINYEKNSFSPPSLEEARMSTEDYFLSAIIGGMAIPFGIILWVNSGYATDEIGRRILSTLGSILTFGPATFPGVVGLCECISKFVNYYLPKKKYERKIKKYSKKLVKVSKPFLEKLKKDFEI